MEKPISQKVIDALEEGALEGVHHMVEYLRGSGGSGDHKKAKVGGVLVGAYTRAIATQTNRMAIEKALISPIQKALPE